MKFNKLFISCLFTLFCLHSFSQTEIKLSQLKVSSLIPVYDPLLLDSLDVNQKSYETKNLLQTQLDFEEVRRSKELMNADANGVFSLPFAPYDNKIPYRDKAVQLLSFHIDADRYCKAELSLTSTDRFEVYVNDKKEKTKETKEDSLSMASAVTIDLTLEPRRYEVIIKRLAGVKNFNVSELTAIITPAKKDSLAEISVNTDARKRVTINDILEGNRVTASSLSPTGKFFLINTKTVYPEGKSDNVLELRETKSNKVVYRFPSSINPDWLSNEDCLIYSRPGVINKNLFLFDVLSLEEKKIVEEIKFDSFDMSPDNRFIIFSLKDEIPADKGDLKRVLAPSDRSGAFRDRNSLYLYSLSDKTIQQITFGKTDLRLSDISHDGKKALILTSEEKNERPFSTSVLYEMNLKTLEIDTLVQDAFIASAFYSPNMKQLLITGSAEAFGGVGENLAENQISNLYDNQVFIYTLKTKEVFPVTKDFNPNVLGVRWSRYDNNIYLRAEDKDCIHVYKYDTQSKRFTLLDLPEEIIASFQVSGSQPVALFRGESAVNAYRVYSLDLKSGKVDLLADPFKDRLNGLELSPVNEWNFTTSGGSEIQGRYYLPPHFDPSKKYPLIVYYYGGTSPTARVFESTYPLQTYAALGYVVYTLNPSGSTGYGQEFSARHVNDWGELTTQEIIEGTRQFCAGHAFVDSAKIGCIGASYGGFMTQYLISQTDLFTAAISHAGISSIASYWGEGYWGYSYSGAASAYNYPWNNPDLYVRQSPLYNADKINTPLLLLHGTSDTNVPIGESIQMFTALKILGKPVEFIQVQGENHAIYDYKKRIEWNKTIHAWFAKWLKDQPEWWEALYPRR
jgi:dipeptidyl aminopeptidase/acylaminoacyl peptidase